MSASHAQPEKSLAAVPVYPDVKLYVNVLDQMRVWEGDGWKAETMSWKTDCCLHSGLSGASEYNFGGPEAARFLSAISINGVDWPVA